MEFGDWIFCSLITWPYIDACPHDQNLGFEWSTPFFLDTQWIMSCLLLDLFLAFRMLCFEELAIFFFTMSNKSYNSGWNEFLGSPFIRLMSLLTSVWVARIHLMALVLLLVQVEKPFKEPLATRFAAWPRALNGTDTHGSGVKTWRATLAIQFVAWLMSLERNWFARKWCEDLKSHTCDTVRRLAYEPWTELIRTEVVWRFEEPHLRYSSLLGLRALNRTDTHGSGVKIWRATLAIQFAAWLTSLEGNWYARKWCEDLKSHTCDTVRCLAYEPWTELIPTEVVWRLEEQLARQ